MKKILTTLVLVTPLLGTISCKQENSKKIELAKNLLKNSNFELPLNKKNNIPNWSFIQHAGIPGYNSFLSDEEKFNGKYSAQIVQINKQVYGMLKQDVVLSGINENNILSFCANIKTDNVGDNGAIISINLLTASGAIIRQLRSEKVFGSKDWKKYCIEEKYSSNLGKVTFSLLLQDSGMVWFDDASLLIK